MLYVCMLGVQTSADVTPAREQCSSELKALLYITTRRSLLDATLRDEGGGAGGRGRRRARGWQAQVHCSTMRAVKVGFSCRIFFHCLLHTMWVVQIVFMWHFFNRYTHDVCSASGFFMRHFLLHAMR